MHAGRPDVREEEICWRSRRERPGMPRVHAPLAGEKGEERRENYLPKMRKIIFFRKFTHSVFSAEAASGPTLAPSVPSGQLHEAHGRA